jgi:hypothetical protein
MCNSIITKISLSLITKSNFSNNFALGWCIVQIIVLPPAAKAFNKETHWKHDELSSPLEKKYLKN